MNIYKSSLVTIIFASVAGYQSTTYASSVTFLGNIPALSSKTAADMVLGAGTNFTDVYNFSINKNLRFFDSEFSSVVSTEYASLPGVKFDTGTQILTAQLFYADNNGNAIGSALNTVTATQNSASQINSFQGAVIGSTTTTNYLTNFSGQTLSSGNYDLIITGITDANGAGAGYSGTINMANVPEPEVWTLLLFGLPLLNLKHRLKQKQA